MSTALPHSLANIVAVTASTAALAAHAAAFALLVAVACVAAWAVPTPPATSARHSPPMSQMRRFAAPMGPRRRFMNSPWVSNRTSCEQLPHAANPIGETRVMSSKYTLFVTCVYIVTFCLDRLGEPRAQFRRIRSVLGPRRWADQGTGQQQFGQSKG